MNVQEPKANNTHSVQAVTPSAKYIVLAFFTDLILLAIFALTGRLSHRLEISFAGMFETAWPFVVGLVLAWILFRVYRDPASLGKGVLVWLTTAVVGLLLRHIFISSVTSILFVIISIITTGVMLLIWRFVVFGFRKIAQEPSKK